MPTPEWIFSEQPVDYNDAMATMNERVLAIKNGTAGDAIWCLQHPSTYTAGTGDTASAGDNGDPQAMPPHQKATAMTPAPVIATGRGGQVTWHGPGQRVCYVMMDIAAHNLTAHDYVQRLLAWAGLALKNIGVETFVPDGKDKIGLWVPSPQPPVIANKICAIGVRLSPSHLGGRARLVSSHGIAINLCPDLSHFKTIVPCGISDPRFGVTSVRALGNAATMGELDSSLQMAWKKIW